MIKVGYKDIPEFMLTLSWVAGFLVVIVGGIMGNLSVVRMGAFIFFICTVIILIWDYYKKKAACNKDYTKEET